MKEKAQFETSLLILPQSILDNIYAWHWFGRSRRTEKDAQGQG